MNPEDRMRELGSRDAATPTDGEWLEFRDRAHRSVRNRRIAGALGSATLVLALVAGAYAATNWRGDETPRPGPAGSPTPSDAVTPTETPADPEPKRAVAVQQWFFEGEELTVFYEQIPQTEAIATATIERLLMGPSGPLAETGVGTTIPDGSELLGLTIESGIATIDLSSEFNDDNLGSGFAGAPLAQVTYTLTQFPTIDAVIFEIEGERVGTEENPYGGHGVLLEGPQTRADGDDYLAPIVVESPYPGRFVDWRFDFFGIANVFEATVSWKLVTAEGTVIKEGFTTATCGTGCWGTFEDTISLEPFPEKYAILQVFESSAEDGSPLHMVEIPLNFKP